MNADLFRLTKSKKPDQGEAIRAINAVFNDMICELRKTREKNHRLVAAIGKLVAKRKGDSSAAAS